MIDRPDAVGRIKRAFGVHPAVARPNLNRHRLFVIYPGEQEYELDDKIAVVPISRVLSLKKRLN